jgi:hypothetical protein
MNLAENEVVSAQVVLKPASGEDVNGAPAITAENVAQYAPSSEVATKVQKGFEAEGFQVGSLVGNSFSITAPVAAFQDLFGVVLHRQEDGAISVEQLSGTDSRELPIQHLNSAVMRDIATIMFTPPPDFGPTQFFP